MKALLLLLLLMHACMHDPIRNNGGRGILFCLSHDHDRNEMACYIADVLWCIVMLISL
jgi:hypothetical protein